MQCNFIICFLLGLSGLACHILFELNSLINQSKAVNITTYLTKKKYSIALTLILIIQAAYFRDMYLTLINKSWNFSEYSLAAFWAIGLFGNTIMMKIISLGTKYFGNGSEK